MNYITLSYDLSDEDFEAQRDDLADEYLEDQGFDFVTDQGPVPSTLFIKEVEGDKDDIEAIKKGFIEFCAKNGLTLVNLLISGPAPITHYCVDEEIED